MWPTPEDPFWVGGGGGLYDTVGQVKGRGPTLLQIQGSRIVPGAAPLSISGIKKGQTLQWTKDWVPPNPAVDQGLGTPNPAVDQGLGTPKPCSGPRVGYP